MVSKTINIKKKIQPLFFKTWKLICYFIIIAEKQISALELTEEYGVDLTKLITDLNRPMDLVIRHLASVFLKIEFR